jgi:hypothetical protein
MQSPDRTRLRPSTLLLSAGSAFLLAACGGDGTGPNAASQVGVGFQLARTSSSARTSLDGTPIAGLPPRVSSTADGLVIARGTDEMVVTRAQLVVKDVKLKRAAAICQDDDDVDCPSIRVGPFLVDVPVTGTDAGRVTVPVPEGTYASVDLRIHKVTSSDATDLAFRQANPDFRDISVRLEGSYNGRPFTFIGDVNARLDIPLTAPLTIGGETDNVTVTIDLGPWFVNPAGGLYAPEAANTPGLVRAKVQNNIRRSFRAFRDRNRDGRED